MEDMAWETFQTLDAVQKSLRFQRDGRLYHALFSQQFNRPMLDRLCELATRTRRIAKTRGGRMFLQDLLSDKRAMLYFSQPSTRTFLSFYAACQIVGLKPAEVRDTSTSSEIKGESPEDCVRTFSSYFDMIIMRHPTPGFAERIAWLLSHTERPVPVINAGSGKDQHPTQALLDIYTLERSFENRAGVDGKTIAFVGDLARGRTVRSLSWLLTLYRDTRIIFCAPEALQIGADIRAHLDGAGTSYRLTDDFEAAVKEADALYMTRMQDEWDPQGESHGRNIPRFCFAREHLDRLKPDAVLLHPLPRRQEISAAVDSDPRAVYWRQVRNGMWIRAALILSIFEKDPEIDRYHQDLTR